MTEFSTCNYTDYLRGKESIEPLRYGRRLEPTNAECILSQRSAKVGNYRIHLYTYAYTYAYIRSAVAFNQLFYLVVLNSSLEIVDSRAVSRFK